MRSSYLLLAASGFILSTTPIIPVIAQTRGISKAEALRLANRPADEVSYPIEGEFEDEPLPSWPEANRNRWAATSCSWDKPDDCEDDGGSGPDPQGRTNLIAPSAEKDFSLVKIKNFPEFKTETAKKCAKIFGRKVCINWHYVFKRNSEVWLLARVTYPSITDEDVESTINRCMNASVAAGVVAGVALLDPSAAQAALWGSFKGCIELEYGKLVRHFRLDVKFEKKPGEWKKI